MLKPKMPTKRPEIKLRPLTAKLMLDTSRYCNGSLAMTISDVGGTVHGDGKELGTIYGAIGGGIVVSIKDGPHWSVNMKDIFEAVYEAWQEQYK
jgi:hypothetical protein